MSTNAQQTSTASLGPTLLLILFIGLKLTGYIDWPWLWVLSPLWIPLAFVIVVIVVGGLIAAILGTRRRR